MYPFGINGLTAALLGQVFYIVLYTRGGTYVLHILGHKLRQTLYYRHKSFSYVRLPLGQQTFRLIRSRKESGVCEACQVFQNT